ncbi:alpha/beta-hydrolase [Bimuria novae-zelandiae CBS 107.79]|uniref:Alpha/beta-hydrolase n=1 Tax=Bimuria novae-zelandiae CBS 107.79 TaxID=1447943 RepID=A0A6A5VEV2_9PLEO|nr:alpha/beta-hydrolase [Bimuria novae-zelandiae CBS 107.79]
MATDTLYHPTLNCTLRGKPSASTVQFRNLKYAIIPGRWQESVLNDNLPHDANGVYDATQFGPSCPHHRSAQAWDLTLVGNVTMPMGDGNPNNEQAMDEFSCLHVAVTVPKSHTGENAKNATKLPVFVWVHGGGLSMGSNNWPQYNLTRFVERSCEIGKPVIGVAINYRVGILGYLASTELGIDGNFGYKDQVVAFRWVKKHIVGFGGDPGRITASAESAGAISLSTLLCADFGNEGLFERVVIMSGDANLRKSRIRSWHDQMYHDQLKFLGLENVSVEERKRQLRGMDAVEMTNKLPLAQYFCGCVDGKFLTENLTLSLLADHTRVGHKPRWCKDFVMGDTRHDGTVLHGRVLANPKAFENLKAACAAHLSNSEITTLLSTYNLPTTSPDQEARSLNEIMSDMRFYIPVLAAHRGWKVAIGTKHSGRYHFHVPNTIEGEFTHLASHELDVALLLQNYFDYLDEKSKVVGTQMMDQWLRYTDGEPWCEAGKVVFIGADGLGEVDEEEYDDKFRAGTGKMLWALGTDRLWKVAEAWQGVRPEELKDRTRGRL